MGSLLHRRLPVTISFSVFFLFLLSPTPSLALPVSSSPYTNAISFSFPTFDPTSPLDLYGDARLDASSGAVRISSSSSNTTTTSSGGLLMYARPLDFGRKPAFSADLDFSVSGKGNGLAFFVAPAGLTTPGDLVRNGGVPPGVFAVEFDTAMDAADRDINDNHVGVDIGSAASVRAFNVSAVGIVLASGERLRAWIDFDGDKGGILEIRLNRSGSSDRPALPFASCHVDLAGVIWQQAMLVGISTSTGRARSYTNSSTNSSQVVTIYSWNFTLTRATPYRMHSDPLDPGQPFDDDAATQPNQQIPLVVVQQGPTTASDFYTPNVLMALALGATGGAAIALLVVLLCSSKVEGHRPVAPVDVDYHSAKPSADFGYEKIVVLTDLGAGKQQDRSTKDSSGKSSTNNKPLG